MIPSIANNDVCFLLFTSPSPTGSARRLVLKVHSVGFQTHSLHPTVDKLVVLGLHLSQLLCRDVKFHV